MRASTPMADEAQGAISTDSLGKNREGLGGSREGRLQPVSVRCLQSPAPLWCHLPSGIENEERSHLAGAAYRPPLWATTMASGLS